MDINFRRNFERRSVYVTSHVSQERLSVPISSSYTTGSYKSQENQ